LSLWHPASLIATGFGVGLLPRMPGTWASLAALPAAWLIRSAGGTPTLGFATAVAIVLGWWAGGRVARASRAADPAYIVIDEIAGQWLVLLASPLDWRWYAVAFALFRLFDIGKPFPVSWIDRNIRGGFGVMLDDLMAAIYALIPLAILEGVLGARP
jgi:phosphatidylglycerophosphatase A